MNVNAVRDKLIDVLSLFTVRDKEWISQHITSENGKDTLGNLCVSYYWVSKSKKPKLLLFNWWSAIDNEPEPDLIRQIVPSLSFVD